MKRQKLYAVDMIEYPAEYLSNEVWEPKGWSDYSATEWPDFCEVIDGIEWHYKPFFWPSTDKVWRSRSSAQLRVDIIERWGGKAVILECDPDWIPVKAANHRRKIARLERAAEKAEKKASELRGLAGIHSTIAYAAVEHPELVPGMEAELERVITEAR